MRLKKRETQNNYASEFYFSFGVTLNQDEFPQENRGPHKYKDVLQDLKEELHILDNGKVRQEMYKFGLMELNMKACGNIIKLMAKVNFQHANCNVFDGEWENDMAYGF